MNRFNIHQDLEHRPLLQQLEILAISGPTCDQVMDDLRQGRFDAIHARFGLMATTEIATHIVAKYKG